MGRGRPFFSLHKEDMPPAFSLMLEAQRAPLAHREVLVAMVVWPVWALREAGSCSLIVASPIRLGCSGEPPPAADTSQSMPKCCLQKEV